MDWEEFDEDQFEELIDQLRREEEAGGGRFPTFRATVRGSTLWVRSWHPNLARRGQVLRASPDAGVALADLTVLSNESGRELIICFAQRSEQGGEEETLLDWAARTGYKRAWLSDRLVDLEVDPERLGKAEVVCRCCGMTWSVDDEPEFWAGVLKAGFFPETCTVCGCGLPEWDS
jgi:hypothetical protein